MRPGPALLAMLAMATSATAATTTAVYRCGNTYSERPCADGHRIELDDGRTPGQRVDAARSAADERRRAAAFEHDRHLRERAPTTLAGRLDRPVVTAQAHPTAPARNKPARRARSGQIDRDDFVAFDTSVRKKKRSD